MTTGKVGKDCDIFMGGTACAACVVFDSHALNKGGT